MPLSDPRAMISQAFEQRRAVVGANVSTIQMIRGVIRAAKATSRPVLIQCNRSGLELLGGADLAAHAVRATLHDSDASVALHLDHADTLPELTDAINAGFNSVMIDGSTLPLDDHINLVREAKGLATWSRLPLEAELGHVAGREAGVTIGDPAWTDPAATERFVNATSVDWLAVAVGNTHGGPAIGGLQLDRLQQISARIGIPLVLHGASGLRESELRAAVNLGVAKINVGTALHQAAAQAIQSALAQHPANLRSALLAAERAVQAAAESLLTSTWAASAGSDTSL